MSSERYRRIPSADTLLVWLFSVAAVAVAVLAPQSHNPDGNFYFGTALRLSRGEFGSFDVLYPPLLSWLMAPFIAAGCSVNAAFRMVNAAAYVGTLALTRRLCAALQLPSALSILVLFLTGLQLLYFIVVLVTADLLAAPFYLGMVHVIMRECADGKSPDAALRSGLRLGIFGALGYYAKAMQLPIALFALFLTGLAVAAIGKGGTRVLKITSIGIFYCALFSAPLIYMLSFRFGVPIFTGQQLQQLGVLDVHDYSPFDQRRIIERLHEARVDSAAAVRESLLHSRPDAGRLGESIPYLCQVTCGLLFGEQGCVWYAVFVLLGLVRVAMMLRRSPGLAPLLVFLMVQAGTYIVVWGPYIRYYFPALALAHLCLAWGLWTVWRDLPRLIPPASRLARVCVKAFSGSCAVLIAVSVARTTLHSVADDWRTKDDAILEYAAALPVLANGRGIITGNGDSPIPGMTAYRLKREYWGSLYAAREHDPIKLGEKLKHWKVSQLVWDGQAPPILEAVPGLVRRGTYDAGERKLTVYDFEK